MTLEEFKEMLRVSKPEEFLEHFLWRSEIAAFSSAAHYAQFQQSIRQRLENTERVIVVGSGNWNYSLNPTKIFKSFDRKSDIDVAVISEYQFHYAWEMMRAAHRRHWNYLNNRDRYTLRSYGEKVYAGFITPEWVPGNPSSYRYQHLVMLEQLSGELVQYKPVRMRFFKNTTEAVDYYLRGVEKAKRYLS